MDRPSTGEGCSVLVNQAYRDYHGKLERVRMTWLAGNPALPADLLRRVIEFREMRFRALHRAQWPDALFRVAAGHPDPDVRRRPADLVPVPAPRAEPAPEPSVPPAELARSEHDYEQARAAGDPELPAELAADPVHRVRLAVSMRLLGHPAFPRTGLSRLADSGNWRARAMVRSDPEAAPELIDRLSRDEHPGVRSAMAADPRLSAARVLELFADEEATAGACFNPKLPREVMTGIIDAYARLDDPPEGAAVWLGAPPGTTE